MNTFLSFVVALFVSIGLDYLWLGVLMHSFYMRELGSLVRATIHYPSAFVVYILIALSIVVLVLPHFSTEPTTAMWNIFWYGAMVGVLIYGIYDCTNYAIISGWSWKFMVVVILWGGVLYGLTSVITFTLVRALKQLI